MGRFPEGVSAKDKNELLGAPLISRPAEPSRRAKTGQVGIVGSEIASSIFVNLYWDESWDVDNQTEPKEALDSYVEAVLGSSYFSGLSEYGVRVATYGGGFLPSPSCTQKAPGSVGFYDPINPSIIGFLQCELDSDTSLPQGDNIVYNIILPREAIEHDELAQIIGSPSFCGGSGPTAWHFHGTPYSAGEVLGGLLGWLVGGFVGMPAEGALIGFLTALSQQGGPFYTISFAAPACGNLTHNLLHEMVEAATDPSPPLSVITTGNGEIVDICDEQGKSPSPSFNPSSSLQSGVILNPGGFLASQVPQYFSNSQQGCIIGFNDTTVPQIVSVNFSGSFPAASGVVAGSGFGTIPATFIVPASANLPYSGIQNESRARTWQAGNSLNSDHMGLTVSSWSNTTISIGGFSPATIGTSVAMTDPLVVWVCNPSLRDLRLTGNRGAYNWGWSQFQ